MTPAQHHAEALRLLALAQDYPNVHSPAYLAALTLANLHASLALYKPMGRPPKASKPEEASTEPEAPTEP